MSVTHDVLKKELDGLHGRVEAAIDAGLKRLADSPNTTKKLPWIIGGIVVAWDLLKALIWALL